ncbi:hypothetical protein C0992_012802 [Termitomyces sp. T32_za158]|nr:hypothetical protein C0992_012802 [Termitomyces sp. T32_za158]
MENNRHLPAGKMSINYFIHSSGHTSDLFDRTTVKKATPKIEYWRLLVRKVLLKLDQLHEHKGPRLFIQGLYDKYLRDPELSTKPFDDAHTTASHLHSLVERYQGEILQISGLKKDWLNADMVRKQVNDTIRGLEDVMMNAMMDTNELRTLHSRQELLFQSLE